MGPRRGPLGFRATTPRPLASAGLGDAAPAEAWRVPPRRPSSLIVATAAASLLAAVAAPAGCSKKGQPARREPQTGDSAQVVAKVDDSVITVGDVQERINKQSPFVRARYSTPERKKEFVDNLIRFEVLANEAERRGYDKDPEVVRVMKQQMISKFLQKDFESKLKVEDVPDAEVEKYYADHPAEFNQKDEVRVSEILVKDKGRADKVLAEVRALPKGAAALADPKPFRDIVAKYSEDEDSKARGGDLSFFDKDTTRYPKPLVEAAFKLSELGDVAQVKTDRGWSIIRLTQKRPGFSRPLSEVKRQIQQRLFRDLRTKAMDAFVADLKKKSNIEVHEENLSKVLIDTGASGNPGAGASLAPPLGAGPAQLGSGPPPGTPAARPVVQGKQ